MRVGRMRVRGRGGMKRERKSSWKRKRKEDKHEKK